MSSIDLMVEPAHEALVVRDPRTFARLGMGGTPVPDDAYWRRRIDDGDVVLVSADPEPGQQPEG